MKQTQEQVNDEPEQSEIKPVQIILPPVIFLPAIHADKFAELNNLSPGIVSAWIDRAYIPTVRLGRYKMVNLAVMYEKLKNGVAL